MKKKTKSRQSKKNLIGHNTQKKTVAINYMQERQVNKSKSYEVFGFFILILLGIIIYSDSFDCSFHFDDLKRIVYNPAIRNLTDLKTIWNYAPNRPLSFFTFAVNYQFNRFDVPNWHVVNLAFHLIDACLVWWLALLIFSTLAKKDDQMARNKKILAFLTALLFVSHPLAIQSVTYIYQRQVTMVAMFYLLSLSLYIKARLSDNGNTSKILLFTGSLVSAVLAMLTKENAFTLPFTILLFEIVFVGTKKFSMNFTDYRVIILLVAFLAILFIIPFSHSFSFFKPILPGGGNPYTLTPGNYFFTQLSVILKYIRLLCLPLSQNLDYDFPISNSFFEARTLISFSILLSLILLALFIYKRHRIISFGIFWFFITLSIESSFIPIHDVIFEYRTYLPSFGFFLILSAGIYLLLWNKHKYLAISIFVIIVVSNSYLTYERNKVWKDDLTLWSDVVSKSPDKPRPLYNLGMVYDYLGQWDKSIADYSKAVSIYPEDLDAYINRGVAYGKLGQWNKAIVDYSKAIEIDPNCITAYSNRGIAYGNLEQWDKEITDDSRVIMIDPKYTVALYNRGIAYGSIGQWDKAIADESRLIEIDPKYADAYNYRGIANCNLGQWDQAITDFSKTIEISKQYATAFYNRGNAYYYMRQWNKAIDDFSKSIELDPKSAKTYYNRGITYGYIGQWDKAIADYTSAIGIDPDYSIAYSSREAAYRNLHSKKM